MPTVTITAAGETAAVTYTLPQPAPVGGWFDDFTKGFNPARWNIRNGDSSSNNQAWYVPANVTMQADGLHLTARRQIGLPGQPATKPYTSGYIDTVGKQSASTGRWEIDACLPTFRGAWPAFWLRGDSTLGEIDILEAVGGRPGTVVQTAHQSTNGDMDKSGFEWSSASFDPAARHLYALERDVDGTLRWYIDDVLTRPARPTDLSTKLHQPMTWLNGPTYASPWNIRINLQVGGSMPTYYGLNVDASSALPGDFVIRSVRYTPR